MRGRTVLLIISGGIAAYKSLELIRRLRDSGANVPCIVTEGGAHFVTPLSVATLSGQAVAMDLFAPDDDKRLGHISLSRQADVIVIAPASADMIARMAHGRADTLASAVLLAASDKPVFIAPAMNARMWNHPATQANIAILAARGVVQIGPETGFLACGEDGAGRMSEPGAILDILRAHFEKKSPLKGIKALVTSGPTFEPLDPVRFLGNRSSGKQGHAIAKALAARGANVTLVTGPVALKDPEGVTTLHVETAQEMLEACQDKGPFDLAVCAAAVSDWRPQHVAQGKIKKTGAPPSLKLAENPDILASLAKNGKKRPALVVGFAAETHDLIENASAKLTRKGCDWLIANVVGNGKAFGTDDNEATLLRRDPKSSILAIVPWPRQSKDALAAHLADSIAAFFNKKQDIK